MSKEYTEEDLRQAFYKGREQAVLPDEKGTTLFLRPTFNGYLRELEGNENPYDNWNIRVSGMIDDKDYDLKTWETYNELREVQKEQIEKDRLEKVEKDRQEMIVAGSKRRYQLSHVLAKLEKTKEGEYFFIKESEVKLDTIAQLMETNSIFIGPMSPDHWEYKIFKGLGVIQSKSWVPINRDVMPLSWIIENK